MSTWTYLLKYLKANRLTYAQYVLTDHWKDLRKRKMESKDPYCCYICGSVVGLQLHHKTYKRIGQERLMDMIWLCRKHHVEVHKSIKENRGNKNYQLWYAAKRIKKSRKKMLDSSISKLI